MFAAHDDTRKTFDGTYVLMEGVNVVFSNCKLNPSFRRLYEGVHFLSISLKIDRDVQYII